jgi:beta-mannosidase
MRQQRQRLERRMSGLRAALRALLPLAAASLVEQSLASVAGNAWRLTSANASLALRATVPGCAHLDLLAAGLIGEPYAGANVDAQAWVKDEPAWTWAVDFVPTPALLAAAEQELVAEGIDAVADVALNGVPLWSQTSAFVRTVASVHGALRAGRNTLEVRVHSPTRAALAASAACEGFCPPPEWGPASNRSAYDQAFMYVRKSACDFGWDFAPNYAPSGITGALYLRGFASAVLEDVAVAAAPATLPVPLGGGTAAWTLTVTALVAVRAAPGATVALTVTVSVAGLPGGAGSARASLGAGDAAVPVTIAVSAAAVWWPRGLGAPALYNASVSVAVDGAGGAGESARDVAVAFRAVAVRRPPMGDGALFFFEVNGHALFLKGANWVPPDAFEARVRRAQLAPRIAALAAAGYTGVRVWGGGRYQSDAFYEECDQLGLLVWQEMSFACALYPRDRPFLTLVAVEVSEQVRRLGTLIASDCM